MPSTKFKKWFEMSLSSEQVLPDPEDFGHETWQEWVHPDTWERFDTWEGDESIWRLDLNEHGFFWEASVENSLRTSLRAKWEGTKWIEQLPSITGAFLADATVRWLNRSRIGILFFEGLRQNPETLKIESIKKDSQEVWEWWENRGNRPARPELWISYDCSIIRDELEKRLGPELMKKMEWSGNHNV